MALQEGIYNIRKRRRSKEFKEHVNSLLEYMGRHGLKRLILTIDNATIRKSGETGRFLERHREELGPPTCPDTHPSPRG